MSQDEFYIGYLSKAPKGIARFMRLMVLGMLVLVLAVASIVVLHQKGFIHAVFEFGELTQLQGVIYEYPYPILKIINEDGISHDFPLIGAGKFGAEQIVESLKEQLDGNLQDYLITLEGSLIYHDGKALLELSHNEKSILQTDKLEQAFLPQRIETLGRTSFKGEIMDSKCYFGVMKPGQQKIHRSCAVRCIAGGIPPVLRVQNPMGHSSYIMLANEEGKAINQAILPYVALPVEVTGNLEQVDEWLVMRVEKIER